MRGMNQHPTCLTFAVSPVADPSATGPKRFRGVAYSGGTIPQYGPYGDACIDLASLVLPSGKLFALVDHDPTQRAGQFSAFMEMSSQSLIVEGELFASTDAGREVSALMAEGAPWQMSVGIQAESESSDKKRKVQCNGRELDVHTIFRNAALREVSFVPVGADPQTSVQAFSRNLAGTASPLVPLSGDTDMTIEELQSQISELSAKLEAETTAHQQAVSDLDAFKQAARQEAVKSLSADLGRDLSEDEGKAFASMSDEVFVTMSATLKSFKPAAPSHLFNEQATNGQAPTGKATLAELNAKIINQVSKG